MYICETQLLLNIMHMLLKINIGIAKSILELLKKIFVYSQKFFKEYILHSTNIILPLLQQNLTELHL